MFKFNMNYLLVLGALVLLFFYTRENFQPDSKVIPKCPLGTERAENGLDCRTV